MDNLILSARNIFKIRTLTFMFLTFILISLSVLSPVLCLALMCISYSFVIITKKPQAYIFISLFFAPIYVGVLNINFGIYSGVLDNILKCGLLLFLAFPVIYSAKKLHYTQRKSIDSLPHYVKLTIFLTLFLCIPVIKAASPPDSFYFLKIVIPILLFIVTMKYYNKINWIKIETWFVVFLLAHFFFSMYQLYNSAAADAYDVVRASGLTTSRNTFSMFMVIMFDFLFLLNSLKSNQKLTKRDILLLICITFLELIGFSRGGWAIFGATAIIFLLWQRRIVLILFLSTISGILVYVNWGKIQQRFISGFGTEEARSQIKAYLQERVSEAPLLGHGFGWAQKFMIDNDLSAGLIQPHDDYIRFLVDMGYIGTGIVLIPLCFIILRMIVIMIKTKDRRIRAVALITILAVAQIFSFMTVYNVFDMFFTTISFVWFFAAVTEMEYRKENKLANEILADL